MVLSGIEWRNCDTCPRKFAVLHGVICHTCPDCRTNKKSLERRDRAGQSTKADGPQNTKPILKDSGPSASKTQKGKKRFAEGSGVTENPLESFRKQRTCRRKNRLSRTTPLP